MLRTHKRSAVTWALGLLFVACSRASGDEARRTYAPDRLDAPAVDGSGSPGKAEARLVGPVEAPASAPTVAFLGDSICAGLHLAEHQAFPALLARRMAAAGLPFRLVNACESGRTSSGARSALDWVLRSQPDLLVLEIGGNDGLLGLPLEELEKNLRALIEGARSADVRVLLLGVLLPPNYGDYAGAFEALYPRLAEEYGLPFVPFFMEGVGGEAELNLDDGLHPTAAGHERLADNVERVLRTLLKELRSRAE